MVPSSLRVDDDRGHCCRVCRFADLQIELLSDLRGDVLEADRRA